MGPAADLWAEKEQQILVNHLCDLVDDVGSRLVQLIVEVGSKALPVLVPHLRLQRHVVVRGGVLVLRLVIK